MRLGITDRGLKRLSDLFKEAIEYTDDWEESWEEEYGEDDWVEPSYEEPDPSMEETLGISSEDFIKGSIVLAAMGIDVEHLEDKQIAKVLQDRPYYLELVPQFNVEGQWVHTLQETHMPNLPDEIQKIVSSDKELCVTAGDAAEFWNFSEYRMVAVVLEGTCKILWNADMFSSFSESEGKLVKSISSQIEFLNQMTEGWLVPAECTLVGIKANWEKIAEQYKGNFPKVKQQLEEMAQSFGVGIIESESLDKTLAGFEVLEAEEAMNFGTCEVDFGSPEHLYEPPEEDSIYDNYLQYYSDQIIDAIYAQNIDKIQELLETGASLQIESLQRKTLVDAITQSGFPVDLFIRLIEPALVINDNEILDAIFRSAVWDGHFDYAEAMADAGYSATLDVEDAFDMLISLDEPPLDMIKKVFNSYKGKTIISDVLTWTDIDKSIISFILNEMDAPLTLHNLHIFNDDLVKTIAEVAPEKVNKLIQGAEAKLPTYGPEMTEVVTDYIRNVKQKVYQ